MTADSDICFQQIQLNSQTEILLLSFTHIQLCRKFQQLAFPSPQEKQFRDTTSGSYLWNIEHKADGPIIQNSTIDVHWPDL